MVNYDRLHVQGSFTARIPKDEKSDPWRTAMIEGAWTERLVFLNTTNYTVDHFDSAKIYLSSTSKSYQNTFLETGFTLRGGVEHLMLELQFAVSAVLNKETAIPSEGLILSVGLVSRF